MSLKIDPIYFANNKLDTLIKVEKQEYLDKIIRVYQNLGEPYSSYAQKINPNIWNIYGKDTLLDYKLQTPPHIFYIVDVKKRICNSEVFDWDLYLEHSNSKKQFDDGCDDANKNTLSADLDEKEM